MKYLGVHKRIQFYFEFPANSIKIDKKWECLKASPPSQLTVFKFCTLLYDELKPGKNSNLPRETMCFTCKWVIRSMISELFSEWKVPFSTWKYFSKNIDFSLWGKQWIVAPYYTVFSIFQLIVHCNPPRCLFLNKMKLLFLVAYTCNWIWNVISYFFRSRSEDP